MDDDLIAKTTFYQIKKQTVALNEKEYHIF